VGIGTTIPRATLDIQGDLSVTGNFTKGGVPFATDWNKTGSTLYLDSGTNIGVGTNNTLGYPLFVQGDLRATSNVSTSNIVATKITTNDITVTGQYFIANDTGLVRNALQINPVRGYFVVATSNQSSFSVSQTGVYAASASNTDVYVNGLKLAYRSSLLKDYDLSYAWLGNSTTQYTIDLTYPVSYQDVVDIVVWPTFVPQSGIQQAGYVYQQFPDPSYWASNVTTPIDIYRTGGNIGMGTTAPKEKVHIQGNLMQTGCTRFANIPAASQAVQIWWKLGTFNHTGSGNTCLITICGGRSYDLYTTDQASKNAITYIFLRAGNGGVNVGQTNLTGSFWSFGRGSGTTAEGSIAAVKVNTASTVTTATTWDLYVLAGAYTGSAMIKAETDVNSTFTVNISAYTANATWVPPSGTTQDLSSEWSVMTAGTNLGLFQKSDGNVGIGSTSPEYKFVVNGELKATKLYGDGSSLTGVSAAGGGGWSRTGSVIYATTSTDTVGIGTSSVTERLDVFTTGTTNAIMTMNATGGTGQAGIKILAGSGATNRASRIDFYNYVASTSVPRWTVANDYDQNGTNDLNVINAANTKVMTIVQSGNVGIGTNLAFGRFIVNKEVADKSAFDHGGAPVTITHQTATSTTVLNDPQPIIHLCRQGTSSQAFGARATLALCRYENSSTNSRTRLDFQLANGAYDTANVMSLQSGGNIGIGTTTPTSKVHIEYTAGSVIPSTNGVYVYNPSNTASQDATICVRTGGSIAGNPYYAMDINGEAGWSIGIENQDTNKLKIKRTWHHSSTTTDNTFVIDTNGNVGVGSNPARGFHIYQSATPVYVRVQGDVAQQQAIEFVDTAQRWAIYKPASGTDIRFFDGTTDRVIVNNGGKTIMGDSTDTRGMHTKNFTNANTYTVNTDPTDTNRNLVAQNPSTSTAANIYTSISMQLAPTATTGAGGRAVCDLKLVRKTAATSEAACIWGGWNSAGAAYQDIMELNTSTGNLLVRGDITAFNTFSDARLKTELTPICNSLSRINQLKPVEYQWRDDIPVEHKRNTKDVGLIAQDVEPLFPLVVTKLDTPGTEGDKYYGLKYDKLVPYLVRAVQELSEENKKLKDELAAIKAFIGLPNTTELSGAV
jgi:hypothetical protein